MSAKGMDFCCAGWLGLGMGKLADEEEAANGEALNFVRDLEVAARFSSSSSELAMSMISEGWPVGADLWNEDAEEIGSTPEVEALFRRLRVFMRSESVPERSSGDVPTTGDSAVILEWPGAPLKAGLGLGRDGTELEDDIGSLDKAAEYSNSLGIRRRYQRGDLPGRRDSEKDDIESDSAG